MVVENITLKKIFENGKNNGLTDTKGVFYPFFTTKTLGELEKKSVCLKKLTVKVIDFDKTEETLRLSGSDTRKSCDAVKILIEKGEIHFIEMKSILNLKKDRKIKSGDDFRQKIKDFEFYKKIRDSLLIMAEIINHKKMKLTGKERELYYSIPKQPIFLTDVHKNSKEGFNFTLDFLSLENELKKVGKNDAHSLKEAKLAFCEVFDSDY